MTERYILIETIDYISEKFNFKNKSIGWFIRLEGSGESFYLFDTPDGAPEDWQPALAAGDKVKITLEKINAPHT